MSINQLYSIWRQRILQLRPTERITRVRNLAWLITAIFHGRSVQLSPIATKIPARVNLLSVVRRLSRFLDNPAVRVREWYEPIARDWLASAARTTGEIRLIADGTKVGFGHQLLIICLAFRHRAIPLAWTWVPSSKGHSSACKQLALLKYVHRLIPKGTPVSLVGDSEFGAIEVMRQVKKWHWHYPGTARQGRVCLASEIEQPDPSARPGLAGLWRRTVRTGTECLVGPRPIDSETCLLDVSVGTLGGRRRRAVVVGY